MLEGISTTFDKNSPVPVIKTFILYWLTPGENLIKLGGD